MRAIFDVISSGIGPRFIIVTNTVTALTAQETSNLLALALEEVLGILLIAITSFRCLFLAGQTLIVVVPVFFLSADRLSFLFLNIFLFISKLNLLKVSV